MDLNNVSVIGRLTHDLNEKSFSYTQTGKALLKASIAVNDGYGENKYTSYFDVTIWGKTAENLRQYLSKGKQVCINGRLRQDRWESNGQKNSRVTIVANTVQLLGDKGAGSGENQQPQQRGYAENYADAMNDGGDFPEDVPFDIPM